MGSTITLTSKVGKGSTFSFELTYKKSTPIPALPLPTPQLPIMIISQDKGTKLVLDNYLRTLGYNPKCYTQKESTSAEFKTALLTLKPAYILLDHVRRIPLTASNQIYNTPIIHLVHGHYLKFAPKKLRLLPKPIFLGDLYLKLQKKTPPCKKTILVVDDNEINQLIAKECLKQLHMTPLLAASGQQCLDILVKKHAQIDLILMDYQMPDMDGIVTTEKIRHWETTHGHPQLPIVALTASLRSDLTKKFTQAGLCGYIKKPFQKEDIERVLQTHLSTSPCEQ
jgi:CheY-like chemotaxis protein